MQKIMIRVKFNVNYDYAFPCPLSALRGIMVEQLTETFPSESPFVRRLQQFRNLKT